jgi:hypothetical protein
VPAQASDVRTCKTSRTLRSSWKSQNLLLMSCLFEHNPHYAKAFDLSRNCLLLLKLRRFRPRHQQQLKRRNLYSLVAIREALRAHQLEDGLAITQQELHQALARKMPAKKSRKVLPSARYITEGDLQTATGKRSPQSNPTQKAGGESPAKRGRRKRQVRYEDVIGAADSEVERQVQALMVGV